MDDKLKKLIVLNSRGSLANHDRKSFYHDSVFQDSYKAPPCKKDPRLNPLEPIANYPQLVRQSSYEADYKQSIQTRDYPINLHKYSRTFGT